MCVCDMLWARSFESLIRREVKWMDEVLLPIINDKQAIKVGFD